MAELPVPSQIFSKHCTARFYNAIAAICRFLRTLNKTQNWRDHLNAPIKWAPTQYKGIAHTSKATATRDPADLLAQNYPIQLPGGGRSNRYRLNIVWRD